MSFCPSCGASNADGVRFCGKCGADTGEGETSVLAVGAPAGQPVVSDIRGTKGKALSGKALRRSIIIGVVVVGLVGAYLAFVKPMDASEPAEQANDRPLSASEYQGRAEEYSIDLFESLSEMQTTLDDYTYESDDVLSESDLDDMRSTYEQTRPDAERAAKEIRALRPPREYEAADRRLKTGAEYYSEDYWNAVDELIQNAQGGTYYEFGESVDELWSDHGDDNPAWASFNHATDELGVDLPVGE